MAEYDELAAAAEAAGYEIFWFGAVSKNKISHVEGLLGVSLSISFRRFLEFYGGGGVVSAEVSGIEGDGESISGGTVVGDTIECRDRYQLPSHLVVIYFHDEEVCWCLDTSKIFGGESPVVSYNLFTKKVDREIAGSFESFMRQHLAIYT